MSNIFDNARNLLKQLQQGASNVVGQIVPKATYSYDFRPTPPSTPNPNVIGNPSQMKLNVGIGPNFVNQARAQEQPSPQPTAIPQQPYPANNQWTSHYQGIYDRVLPQKKLSRQDAQVLVTSENGKENPNYQNFNLDPKTKKPTSVDTGLLQINTPLESPEIAKLKDPEYNINKGLDILRQRNAILGDPVLAIASYNKGAGGAVLDPVDALRRAKAIYKNAGVPLPDTAFTRNPQAFVDQNMGRYKQYGLFK